jgi:hypothetical protein
MPVSELIHKLQEQGEFRWRMKGDRVCIHSSDGLEIGFISDGHLTIGEYSLLAVDMAGS